MGDAEGALLDVEDCVVAELIVMVDVTVKVAVGLTVESVCISLLL